MSTIDHILVWAMVAAAFASGVSVGLFIAFASRTIGKEVAQHHRLIP